MKFFRKPGAKHKEEHEKIQEELEEHESRLERHAALLRRLELEAGIYKPPLKGVDSVRRG